MESIKSLKAEGKPTPDVQPEYIATFCRNVWHVRYLKYRTLQEEMDPPTAMSAAISKELEVMDGNVMWYLLLRCAPPSPPSSTFCVSVITPGDQECNQTEEVMLTCEKCPAAPTMCGVQSSTVAFCAHQKTLLSHNGLLYTNPHPFAVSCLESDAPRIVHKAVAANHWSMGAWFRPLPQP